MAQRDLITGADLNQVECEQLEAEEFAGPLRVRVDEARQALLCGEEAAATYLRGADRQ